MLITPEDAYLSSAPGEGAFVGQDLMMGGGGSIGTTRDTGNLPFVEALGSFPLLVCTRRMYRAALDVAHFLWQ